MKLYYSALSPFCRKVRMALDHKGLTYEIEDDPKVEDFGHLAPRAEVPVLEDGDLLVANSPDIVAYLEHLHPEPPHLLPPHPKLRARVRTWERTSDTVVDAIVTALGNFAFSDIGPAPEGFLEACRDGMAPIYDALQRELERQPFVCGELSIVDFALRPHLQAARFLGVPWSPERHPALAAWSQRLADLEVCKRDDALFRDYMGRLRDTNTQFDKINWGTFRLEWLLASGFHEFLGNEIRQDKVLWSVGPSRNGLRSHHYRAERDA